jgi:hypothetical protein
MPQRAAHRRRIAVVHLAEQPIAQDDALVVPGVASLSTNRRPVSRPRAKQVEERGRSDDADGASG